jgi:hypothetical protein
VKNGTKTVKADQYEIVKIVQTKDADGSKLTSAVTVYNKDNPEADTSQKAQVKDKGVYTVTIRTKNSRNYSGSRTVSLSVIDKTCKIADAKIKTTDMPYTGSKITLNETQLTVSVGGTPLTRGTDYEVASYTNNTKIGTAKVTIKGIGKYAGTKTASFRIKSKTLKYAGTGSSSSLKANDIYLSYAFLSTDVFG